MQRVVIGTAGHIDHGKTTLVRAITGIDTDRLKEEKKRGISIELGFAPLALPNGDQASVVDVPGHERFIRHMLAGAFGIDIVLFIIAADEGVMPQTREHMDIIELLGVNKGIVVLTKIDMVDEEWLFLMEEEVREYIDKTILKGAPIISVSAPKKIGLDNLLNEIQSRCLTVEERPVLGQSRLPIDRVFSIAGFGTVVTGTLWSGQINVGDNLELMPSGKNVKVRTLEVHNDKVMTALAGQRVAVNLQGINMDEVKRGYWLSTTGFLSPSFRVDTRLHLLRSSSRTLRNWNRVRFHLGTDEALGRVALLDRDELLPGEEAYAQIVLEKQIVCHKDDPFVIRYYSPVTTIGGGSIIDPLAPKQKRFREDVLDELALKEEGTLYDVLLHELESSATGLTAEQLVKKAGSNREQVLRELQVLIDDERVLVLKDNEYYSMDVLSGIKDKITGVLNDFHESYPLRFGYPKEDMRSRYFNFIDGKAFNLILKFWEQSGNLVNKNNLLLMPGFKPSPQDKENEIIIKIREQLNKEPFQPPDKAELFGACGIDEIFFNEIMSFLLSSGELIKINADMFFTHDAISKGQDLLNSYFAKNKELTLGEARDLFATSRKYMLPLLEYYDKIRFTRRVGDIRVKTGS